MDFLKPAELNRKYSDALIIIDGQRQKIERLETENKGLRAGLLEYFESLERQDANEGKLTPYERSKLKATIAELKAQS